VKPTVDERVQFLDIFEQNLKVIQTGDDSSDQDIEKTRSFYKKDLEAEFGIGDKVNVIKGELMGATGVI